MSLLPEEVPKLPCGYDHEAFEAFAPALADAPEGGERCLACFAMRLNYTAEQAKEHGFEYFTTTLSVSPHKNADNVNRIGEEAGKRYGVKYLFADFKKKNGYLRSLELSREYELYRQDYCGCRYSNQKNSDLSTMKNEECYSVSACCFGNDIVPIGFPNVGGGFFDAAFGLAQNDRIIMSNGYRYNIY